MPGPRAFVLLIMLGGVVSVIAISACGETCEDADGDGFGAGCERGPDCDDTRATRAVRCEEPPPDCERDEYAAGCACNAGTSRDCYAGTEETLGVASCRAGRQVCPTGSWTACEGAINPAGESCNDRDDDCDGRTDEGVRSPCGECDSECRGGVWGEGDAPFVAEDGFMLGPYGELMLRREPIETATVFVANTGEGTVSAIDPEAAVERARYRTEAPHPERVAIDYEGHAWVLDNGSDRAQAVSGAHNLVQIAGDDGACVDRDGDGVQTSHGPSELLAIGEDECVLSQLHVGDEGSQLGALAIGGARAPDDDGTAVVWIGLRDEEAMLALHGGSGQELLRVETPGVEPYAAAIDPWGTLWVLDRRGKLATIEAAFDPPRVRILEAPLRCYVLDALAIDSSGVLSLSGGECESIVRYDPVRERWTHVKTPGVLDARGIAVRAVITDEDPESESWVTHTAGRISRVTHAPLELGDTYSLAGDNVAPFDSAAVSADSSGRLWIVSSVGGPDSTGVLTRFDATTRRVTAQVPVGYLPRAQGDLTGERRVATTEPEATTSYVFEGCNQGRESADPSQGGAATGWLALHVAGVIGSDSEVELQARHAFDDAALRDATFETIGSLPEDETPFPLALPEGGLVEVRITLRTRDHLGGPRITRVGLEWRCPGPD